MSIVRDGAGAFNVAVVSPTPTAPRNFGNRARIGRMLARLKDAGARIHFIYYPLEGDWRDAYPAEHLAAMRAEWDDVHVVIPSVPYHRAASRSDHRIDDWWDPALGAFLRWFFRVQSVDALIVNYTYLSKALEFAPDSCLKVLDTHDKFGGRRLELAKAGIAPEFFHTTEADEAIGVGRADLVLAIKDQEQAYFERLGARDVLTLPFCAPPTMMDAVPIPDGPPETFLRIGLFGAKNNLNLQSTAAFIEVASEVFARRIAPARLVLGGSMCAGLDAWRGSEFVEFIGAVEDVSEFYANVDVVAVPMTFGTGQKIKVGEALSMGAPVVSHRHAFEGYPPRHRCHRLSSLEAIAEACVDLAFDRSGLRDLRDASISAATAQLGRVEAAEDALAARIRGHAPRCLVHAEHAMLQGNPFFIQHVLELMSIVAPMFRVTLLIEDARAEGVALSDRDLWRARRYGSVVARSDAPEFDASASALVLAYAGAEALRAVLGADWSGVIARHGAFAAPGMVDLGPAAVAEDGASPAITAQFGGLDAAVEQRRIAAPAMRDIETRAPEVAADARQRSVYVFCGARTFRYAAALADGVAEAPQADRVVIVVCGAAAEAERFVWGGVAETVDIRFDAPFDAQIFASKPHVLVDLARAAGATSYLIAAFAGRGAPIMTVEAWDFSGDRAIDDGDALSDVQFAVESFLAGADWTGGPMVQSGEDWLAAQTYDPFREFLSASLSRPVKARPPKP